MGNQSPPVIAATPQGAVHARLIPIIDALVRRGAVSHAVELWADDFRPSEISFTITAAFGMSGDAMKAEHQFLVDQLETNGFTVRELSNSTIGDHDIFVTASCRVAVPSKRGTSRLNNLKPVAKCTG